MKTITARNIGLITGVVMIALSVFFFYVLKQPVESNLQYFVYAVFAAGIIWSLTSFKKKAENPLRFKDYFSEGFKTFAITTMLMVLFVFVFFSINTQIRDARFEENAKLLLQQGDHTPAEIAENTKQMKRIFMPMMLGITTFMYLFLGSMVTIVAGVIITRKKDNISSSAA